MADDLGGLFDSDPGFLEELASGAGDGQQAVVAQQQSLPGMMSQNASGMQPNMAMINNMQQGRQPHTGYNNMTGMQGNGYGSAQYQQNSQQFGQQSNYNQYSNQQMFNQNVMVSTSGQTGAHMMPQGSPHRNQFGSPPGGMVHQGQVMYQYSNRGVSQAGPRLPNPTPQQQSAMKVGVPQMQNWSQNPQMFNQQQQQQQQQQQTQQGGYLPQHDYNTGSTNNQQIHMQQQQQQFPNTQSQQSNQNMYMQRMTSPTGISRMPASSVSQNNPMSSMPQQQMFQHSDMAVSQSYQNTSMSQCNLSSVSNINSDPMAIQQQQQQQQQQQYLQTQPASSSQYQQFQYRSPPQVMQQNLTENCVPQPQQAPNMMRFPQTSPNQQHRMPFNNINSMGQQRQNVPMLSPRPTPPPPSPTVTPSMLSPTGSTSSHQGSYTMEPSPQPSNNVGLFQQSSSVDTAVNDIAQPPAAQQQQQNFQSGPFNQPMNSLPQQQKPAPTNNSSVNSNANVNNSVVQNFPSSQGQASPSFKVLPGNTTSPPQSGTSEVQALSQQIQQLYSMPQTPQTQQKLLDLQEKLRLVKSQQMLQGPRQQPTQPSQTPTHPPPQPQVFKQKPAGKKKQQQQQQQQAVQPPVTGTIRLQVSPASVGAGAQQIQLIQATNSSAGPQRILIIQQQPAAAQQPASNLPIQQQQLSQPPAGVAAPQQVPIPTNLPQSVGQGATPAAPPPQQQQHIVINPNLASGGSSQQIVVQNPPSLSPTINNEPVTTDTVSTTTQQQEKANKIIAEAIAKAQKSGNTTIPRVIDPPELPSTLEDVENGLVIAEESPEKSKKKKRKYTPRKPKDKDSKEDGTEKPAKTPKKSKKSKKKEEVVPEAVKVETEGENTLPAMGLDEIPEAEGEEKKKSKKKKKKKAATDEESASEKTPKSNKKSKKPPATFLKNKKRKRRGSSDGSDVEIKITPPPSPEHDEYKRRSGRHAKRKKYLDDVDLNLSEEDETVDKGNTEGAVVKPVQLFVDQPAEEDAVIVDKILGARMRKNDPDDEEETEEVEEYFVKYKNFSYLHCEWKTEAEIRDKRIQGKIRRFRMKKMQITNYFDDEEELFNPDYVEVDRVLEESIVKDPVTEEDVVHYLVKWRSLPYEDSTWELQQDVDPEKVKLFKKFRELPPKEDRKHKSRPKSADWEPLKESHQYKGGNCLREYQLEGVNWLTFSWHKRQNCILADEMGLGKTIQSIAFLQEMYSYGIKGPFLVVAPLSTIANWQREFETWTELNAITYHGTSPSRLMLQEYEMYYRDEEGNKIKEFYKFNSIITTYEIILSDLELLRSIDWRCIIIDEAHRLKNKNCSLMKCLKCFSFEHKVLLSGTPLQNNVEELFSLLNFLEPTQFNSSEAFLLEFGTLHTEEQVDKLKAILKPMMLRRLKEDVEKNLAAKEETIIEVELTNIQKKYYRAILERNFTFLCKGGQAGNVPSLMNTMMELRKCCNHPYLINGAEDNILSELRAREKQEPEHIQALIQASGKFVLLDKLLPKLKQNGNRVLIFSQMIRVLDIIEDYLINKRYLYERLDGRIRGNLRQEAIDRYSKPDSDRFVFLICTKAGGLGINLTAADTVIIYDSDWNPQNDLQAQARCHRIGQNKMVKVYRLITRNSYEREMFDRASMKLGLDKAVLQSMGGDKLNQQPQLSKREVEELLRKGAYGALMEDDSAGDKFCEEDIDQILKGRTQVIQIESEGKGSTFAKASFSVTTNRDDIDINDPEFWQKWAKKADVDVDNIGTKELIVDEPRVRKKTARYGNNDSLADMSDLGSDSETDEEKRGRKLRRGRRGDDDEDFEKERHKSKSGGTGYGRSELFKVEKGLLHYGWGRWKDILAHARFKRPMEEKDVENVAKAILLFGLQYYKGDERIKEFIWDLISKDNHENGGLKNHSGLSAPVPRGRKGKKAKNEEIHFDANEEIEKAGIKMDRDIVHNKNAYKRHIHRHSNKVLLRVRTLYYLKHEVLGDVVEQIDQGIHVKDISNLPAPIADNEPPTFWWDELADKSLLIGVYKHGYEKYNLMRQDPTLVFLSKCGPPDGAALAAELKDDDDNENEDLDDTSILKDDDEESLSCAADAASAASTPKNPQPSGEGVGEENQEEGKFSFPTFSEMNTRLRKIITNYQRDFKKQQLKMQQQAKKVEKRERLDAVFREREARRRETLQRWTRREETDFYRIVSTYGIEFDRVKGRYIWDKFRVMAKLDKKTDEQLTEYFISFYHMCLRVCRKIKEEAYPPTPIYIEAITEERANRCIARIDLLSKIREEIIVHPKMDSRIKSCQKSLDLPTWWVNGKHDRELLIGAAKHGLARTDYFILNDPNLSFHDMVKQGKSQTNSPANFQLFGKDIKKDVKSESNEASIKEEKEEKSDDKKPETSVKEEATEKLDNKEKEDMKMEVAESSIKEEKGESTEKTDTDNVKASSPKKEKEDEDSKEEMETDEKEEVKNRDTEEVKKETEADDVKKETEENNDETEMETDAKPEKADEESEKIDKPEDEAVEKSEKESSEKGEVKEEEEEVKKEDKKVEGENKEKVKSEKETEEIKKEDVSEVKEDPDDEVRRTLEDGEELVDGISASLLSQWPKDRVVFHRLEQICYCVETGDWPFPPKMKNVHILGIDSGSNTPTRSLTPSQTPKQDDEASKDLIDKMKKKEKDFEVQMAEGDGLKMTFHKRAEKNKRSLDALEAEKVRIQAILAQNLAVSQASSDDSQQEAAVVSTSQSGADSPFLNGSHMSEEEMMMNRSLIEQGLMFSDRRGRRGRKRKAEKMAEIAMAEALARRQTARAIAGFDLDSHVPVVNLEDGTRLSGDEAPLKKDLEGWLDQHPGYMVDSRDDDLEQGEIVPDFPERRKGRKPKFDPAFLEVEKLTGEENVSVINRLTGKKITGAKAPPLRYLAEWLEQNPMWDVDPKWAELVRAKGTLPKTLLPRVGTPSRRGRRPRDSPLSHSMMGGGDPHQAAALAASIEAMNAAQLMAAGFGKMPMPFAHLGLNPMALGLPGFGFPGLGAASTMAEKTESKHKDSKSSKEEGRSKEENSSPHPSFPLMFNPLLYNPLLAAQSLGGFPANLTNLATTGLLNGHSPMTEEEHKPKSSKSSSTPSVSEPRDQSQAQDLSVKSKPKTIIENMTAAHSGGKSKPRTETSVSADSEEMPCDLSMKSKSKPEDKSKQKICSSDKLSRIVDSLKVRVNKMDDKGGKEDKESKRNSLDAVLNLKQSDSESPEKDSIEASPSSKKDTLNSLSQKLASQASQNHSSKEPVPKIVQELLAAKQQKEREDLLNAKQQKLEALVATQRKLLKQSLNKQKSISAQGSEKGEEKKEEVSSDGEKS